MARSVAAIAKNIAETMEATDPGTDTTKGPFYDLAIVPPANEIASCEAEAEKILSLYSKLADTPNSLVAGEIAALGRSFKVPTPRGQRARVLLAFYMTALPSTPVSIQAGLPVASDDGTYVFTTLTAIRGISAAVAVSYLDSSSGRYLIFVEAEAVGTGAGYNLPAYRITRMLMPVTGISGVYNTAAAYGGSSPDQSTSYLKQIQDSFSARDTSTIQGVLVELQRRFSDYSLTLVPSTDRSAFTRPVTGAAADIYTIAPWTDVTEDVFAPSASGVYPLTKRPVLAIDAVYINGVLQTRDVYKFLQDMTPATTRSAMSTDSVRITAPLSTSDTIRIRYQYAASVWNIAQSLDEADIMGMDILPRLTNTLPVTVTAEVVCPTYALANIKSTAISYLTTHFGTSFSASGLVAYLQASHSDLQLVRVRTFCRKGRSTIETIPVPAGRSLAFEAAADIQFKIVSA